MDTSETEVISLSPSYLHIQAQSLIKFMAQMYIRLIFKKLFLLLHFQNFPWSQPKILSARLV